MAHIPEDLTLFLSEQRDAREYRRGLAVKMALQGYLYEFIGDMLQVSPIFASKAKKAYDTDGVAGLRRDYQGSQSYLSTDERRAVQAWLQTQES